MRDAMLREHLGAADMERVKKIRPGSTGTRKGA